MSRQTKRRCRQLTAVLIACMVFLSGNGVSTLAATISGNDAPEAEAVGGIRAMMEQGL